MRRNASVSLLKSWTRRLSSSLARRPAGSSRVSMNFSQSDMGRTSGRVVLHGLGRDRLIERREDVLLLVLQVLRGPGPRCRALAHVALEHALHDLDLKRDGFVRGALAVLVLVHLRESETDRAQPGGIDGVLGQRVVEQRDQGL